MSLLDRLQERLGEILDEVTLPDRVRRRLDHAEGRLAAGAAAEARDLLLHIEADRPGLWRSTFLLGLAEEALGRLPKAARAYGRAVEIRDNVLARVALGRVAHQMGDLRTAREHLEAALERRPTDRERLEILLSLADVHEAIGPGHRAVPVLRHASRLAPDDFGIRLRLAHALQSGGDDDAAVAVLEPAVTELASATARRALARLYRARGDAGDTDRAARLYEGLLSDDADDAETLEGLAAVYADQGRVAEALPLFQHALSVAPIADHGRLHACIARCFRAADQLQKAMDAYRASATLAPDHAATLLGLARTGLTLGLFEESLGASTRALELLPGDAAVTALRGRALIALGRVDEARVTLTPLRAAGMTPDVLIALGELALRTGDAIEAIALLREAGVRGHATETEHLLTVAYQELAPALPELGAVEQLSPPRLAPFLESLSSAVAAHPLLADLIPETTALRQQLDTPLAIAVLGEFNAGKSTLINAFVGEAMVATGVLPTTSHINVIRYGPRRVARWTHTDDRVEELPFDEAATLVKREPDRIKSLEFCFPHPDLRSIHFWDTPGFNAPDDDHETRARVALRTADAVVWLLDAGQALSSTEFERIQEIASAQEKLLVVINKVDRLGGDAGALEEILEHVEGHLRDAHAGIFPLSALEAFRGKQADDAEVPDPWQAFERALRSRFFERAGRLKSIEVARGLARLITESLDRASTARAILKEARTEILERRKSLAVRGASWETDVARPVARKLASDLRALRTKVTHDVAELSTPQPGLLSGRKLLTDDNALLLAQLADGVRTELDVASRALGDAAAVVDADVVGAVEAIAVELGPPESRTLRRRIEAYLAETRALRDLLVERLVRTPMAVVDARINDRGETLLDMLANDRNRTEGEREALLQRVVSDPGAAYREQCSGWSREYLAAAERLCHHVERDLDILELDLIHRIIRPFEQVLDTLEPLALG